MDELHDHESALARLLGQVPGDDLGRDEHRTALRSRALDAFDAAARQRVAPAWKRSLDRGREIMRHPLPRLILAASVCLAVAAIWLLVPGQQSTAQAFNKFAEAIVGAKSATFQLEVTIEGHGKQHLQSYYLAPGKMRSEMTGFVTIADMKTGKTVNLLPDRKTALVMNIKGMSSEPAGPQFSDLFEQLRNLLSKSRRVKEDGVKQLGEKEIDGRRVIGFRCDSPLESMDLWGDPETGLPVRVESALHGIPRIEYTMSRFFFNGELDPTLFETEPPVGYKIEFYDIGASKPTEVALIEGLRLATDLSDGRFPDNLDAVLAAVSHDAPTDHQTKQAIGPKNDGLRDMTPELLTIGRGMTFAAQLPESADAHYAGKDVKRGEPNRPIFWYKPAGARAYRVIYADLTVKEAETAPNVATEPLVADRPPTFQAFNMFAEAIVDAKSATFQMEAIIEGQGSEKSQGFFLAPGKMRNETSGMIHIMDMRAGKMLFINPKKKTVVVMNMQNMFNEPGRPRLDDIFERVRDLLSETRYAKENGFTQLGEKEIDGHHAIGFRYASPAQSLTLWGDPTTALPVLVETVWSGTPKTEVTMSHFELNEKLDPALFDTTPPADYKIQAFDVDASKPTEASLIEMLSVATDLNGGLFISHLDMASTTAILTKHLDKVTEGKKDKSKEIPPELMKLVIAIGRGITFATEVLPESADAHYAGKGVKLDEPDRPIFWYKPEGATAYRVIYADLSVKDAQSAPEVTGAVRLEKVKPADKQEAPEPVATPEK